MRVNPDASNDLIAYLNAARQQESNALRQLSSGRRVAVASDDPSAMANMVHERAHELASDDFVESIATVRDYLSTADSALNSVVSNLERAVSIGVEGATGTQTAQNRRAMAQEIRGIRDQVLSLANLRFRGTFLFSGTDIAEPFQVDPSGTNNISYQGNSSVNSVEIGDGGRLIDLGTPGNAIFTSDGADVFAALQRAIVALDSNDTEAIGECVGTVRNALDHVSQARVVYGGRLAQLDADQQFLQAQKLQSQSRQDELVGADPAETISRLQQAQFARDAILAATGRSSKLSLLDYLR